MSNHPLSCQTCVPCQGGVAPLDRAAAEARLADVPGWYLTGEPLRLVRDFKTKTFLQAQTLATRVGAIAEEQGHHPDICYGWGYCTVSFYTHKIQGLHDNDFIMAAKVNEIAADPELS